MIWSDQTHGYTATDCPDLGRPCPAAERMITRLAAALTQARPLTQEDFEITGNTVLDGCPKSCPAQFAASHDRIRIYCGVEAQTPRAGLDRFADAMFSPGDSGFAATTAKARPCALIEAIPNPAHAQAATQVPLG